MKAIKFLAFLLMLLMLLIISGCTRFSHLQEQPTDLMVGQSVNRIPADTFMGPPLTQQATLRLEVETSTATSGRFKLNNHSDQRVIYDNYFAVDVFEGDEWRELLFKEDVFFQDIGLYASAHSQTTFLINWSEYFGTLPKGTYRLIKEVTIEEEGPQTLMIEFMIE